MYRFALILTLPLAACAPDSAEDDALDTDALDPAANFSGAPLADPSNDVCPKLESGGLKSFLSNGVEREVIVRFPKDKPENMPVLFYWYGLGDNAAHIDSALDMKGFANRNDAVVVIPESLDPFLMTWDFMAGDGGDDLVLFDDMRTCLSRELGVDLNRISSAGFSFGGLWTTALALDRSDVLSTSVVMSGGTDAGLGLPYVTPARPLPMMLMWGGDGDTYSAGPVNVDFAENTKSFSASLRADGHFVTACDHGLGHAMPFETLDVLEAWALGTRFDAPSPFEDGLGALPSYCTVAD